MPRIRWYVPRALGEEIATSAHPPRRLPGARSRVLPMTAFAAILLGISACGSEPRQDEDEPSGNFPVEVTAAKFATDQRLAQTSDLRLDVSNVGDKTVPDLAVNRAPQRYVPLSEERVQFLSSGGAFRAEIHFDADGLVTLYEDFLERVA